MFFVGTLVILITLLIAIALGLFLISCFRDRQGRARSNTEQIARLLRFFAVWTVTAFGFALGNSVLNYQGYCTLFGSHFDCGRLSHFGTSLIAMLLAWPFRFTSYLFLAVQGRPELLYAGAAAVCAGVLTGWYLKRKAVKAA